MHRVYISEEIFTRIENEIFARDLEDFLYFGNVSIFLRVCRELSG